jgi:TPR repeat protein
MYKYALACLLALALCSPAARADQLEEGYTAALNGKYRTALSLLQPLADQGNPRAQFYVGELYMNGEGVAPSQLTAVKWFRKAAERGDTDALTALGVMYEKGAGVTKDDAQAVAFYQKAANLGNPKAQLMLSTRYAHGDGVPQNREEAFFWQFLAVKRNPQFSLTEALSSSQGLSPAQIKDVEQRVQDWRPAQ